MDGEEVETLELQCVIILSKEAFAPTTTVGSGIIDKTTLSLKDYISLSYFLKLYKYI